MPDEKILHMFYEAVKEAFDRIENLESLCKSHAIDFQEYATRSPKPTNQWVEERLRALEHKVQLLEKKG